MDKDLVMCTVTLPTHDEYDTETGSISRQRVVCYVSVYEIHRCYGGPEEGGWYYDHLECKCSVPLVEPGSKEEIEQVKAFLMPRFDGFTGRECDSVHPRHETHRFELEDQPGRYETAGRPRYE